MTWQPLPLRTVTPAFLGRFPEGAGSGQMAFPIPSLRGVLAYWLRALAGPHVGDDTGQLLRAETELFGTAAGEGTAGPSKILLRGGRIAVSAPPAPDLKLGYLMGPGLTDENQPRPRRLGPSILKLEVRNLGRPSHADLFFSALWALRTFGGIGARTRRGFGTLAIDPDRVPRLNLERNSFDRAWLMRDHPADLPAVLDCVARALADLGVRNGTFAGQPKYPCFADGWFHVAEHWLREGGTHLLALADLGDLLKRFRHPGTPPQPGRLPNTAGYRQIARAYAERRTPAGPFPDGALGLPVVYTVHGFTESVTVEPVDADASPARRASPLWLRVTPRARGWRLRSLAFHTQWLPDDVRLRVKMGTTSGGRRPDPVAKPSAATIRAELDRWFTFIDAERPAGPGG
ncbi:RAMP superfamily CRISPR-associated protein [Acrocarpospora sp. B8E8]|uniref:RAMP superfamily CRISPR-associated protein n=1 Tax=Acrocarpospora sp. B8E8 TaxID=3153572 RepID=UPI00325E5323